MRIILSATCLALIVSGTAVAQVTHAPATGPGIGNPAGTDRARYARREPGQTGAAPIAVETLPVVLRHLAMVQDLTEQFAQQNVTAGGAPPKGSGVPPARRQNAKELIEIAWALISDDTALGSARRTRRVIVF
jgi:hypothetical protein